MGVVVAGETGIALLRSAEKAFFGCEQRSAAVDVYAPAFEDYAAAFVRRLPDAMFEFFINLRSRERIFFVIAVFGPAVEDPMRVGDLAGSAAYGDGTGVAHPAAIGGDAKEIDGG